MTYGDKEFTWNTGRNLESIVDGDNNYSYTYDENGIRTSKTINGVTTYYNTRNGVIISQSDGTNTMYFQYDTNGTPLGFIYNGTQYFYMTNQMGDIIAITESDGNIIAQYVYDEWGKLLNVYIVNEDNAEQVEVANANPLRYRGYYYDTETGYYYLQSRYYNASICRFINADIPEIAQISKKIPAGTNLFAYCCNDPINNVDFNGHFKVRRWMIAFPLDMIFMATPAGALFAPIKYAGKKFGLALVKTKFSHKIFNVLNWIIKNVTKYAQKIVNTLKSIKAIKNFKFIKNLTSTKISSSFLGFALFKTPIYKTLNLLLKNADIVLSLGGFISRILDLCIDRKVDNAIWNI